MEPSTLTSPPVPPAPMLMIPPLPPAVELFIANKLSASFSTWTLLPEEMRLITPPLPLVELLMKPSTVIVLAAAIDTVPPLPVEVLLSILAVSEPPSTIETALSVELMAIVPPIMTALFRIEPATVTFSPAPLADRLMLPPVPPVVELLMANVRLLALLETVTLPSAPDRLMTPPLPPERLSTTPSTETSSPATSETVPPLPPVVELSMSPRTAPLAAPMVISLLADVTATVPAVVVAVLSIIPSTLEEPALPPELILITPP